MNHKYITVLWLICSITPISFTNAIPQLDLPPLKPPEISENLVNNAAVSFTNDGDANDEANDGSQLNYDNDRSQRFGPPYSLDNIQGAPPTFDPRSRSNDRPYSSNNNDPHNRPEFSTRPFDQNYPNRPDRPDFRDRSNRPIDPNFPNQRDRPNDRNYPDNFGYVDQRQKPIGDDDKYYRDRNRFNGDQYRPNMDEERNRFGDDNRYGNPVGGFEGYRQNDGGGVSLIVNIYEELMLISENHHSATRLKQIILNGNMN